MKAGNTLVVLIGALVVLGVEEWRISRLRGRVLHLEGELMALVAGRRPATDAGASSGVRARALVKESQEGEDTLSRREELDGRPYLGGSIGSSLRRVLETPEEGPEIDPGLAALTAMWCADLIREFELSTVEEGYFLGLVGRGLQAAQDVEQRFMVAGDEKERGAIVEEARKAEAERKEAMREFLNHDGDFAAYEAWEARLPERRQLEGLRSAMIAEAGPMTAEQEELLVDAMYRARVSQDGGTDWNGPGGLAAIASGGAGEKFEREWERSSAEVRAAVDEILDPSQRKAFHGFQAQFKALQAGKIEMLGGLFEESGKETGPVR